MDSKFPEPRGWALKWEGAALLPAADPVSRQDDGPETVLWRQVGVAAMPASGNGNGTSGLTRPRGWALQWEASALTEGANGHEPAHLAAVEPVKEGAA
jgi:hypothetical protein